MVFQFDWRKRPKRKYEHMYNKTRLAIDRELYCHQLDKNNNLLNITKQDYFKNKVESTISTKEPLKFVIIYITGQMTIPCRPAAAGPWWRHQMKTFSALLALCAGNSLVTGEFPSQRPVTRSFDIFFDLRLNNRLSEQSWGWWFETPSRPLRRRSNVKN